MCQTDSHFPTAVFSRKHLACLPPGRLISNECRLLIALLSRSLCRLYRPAYRCVPVVQGCTSVCVVCKYLHIGVCLLYRPAHPCVLPYRPAHRCVPPVQICTSVCAIRIDLHIGVCSTQYRECNKAFERPKSKASKVGPMQAMKVYGGCGCTAPLVFRSLQ